MRKVESAKPQAPQAPQPELLKKARVLVPLLRRELLGSGVYVLMCTRSAPKSQPWCFEKGLHARTVRAGAAVGCTSQPVADQAVSLFVQMLGLNR